MASGNSFLIKILAHVGELPVQETTSAVLWSLRVVHNHLNLAKLVHFLPFLFLPLVSYLRKQTKRTSLVLSPNMKVAQMAPASLKKMHLR